MVGNRSLPIHKTKGRSTVTSTMSTSMKVTDCHNKSCRKIAALNCMTDTILFQDIVTGAEHVPTSPYVTKTACARSKC